MRSFTFLAAVLVAALTIASTALAAPQAKKAGAAATASAATPVNLNTATRRRSSKLPGIGRATAKRIIEYRQKNGAFKKVEELMNVKGIGEKSFLKLKPLISVGAPTRPTSRAASDSPTASGRQRPDAAVSRCAVMRMSAARGFTLLELLFILAILVVLLSIALPVTSEAIDALRTQGAARYLAARVLQGRMSAISRSTITGLRFVAVAGGTTPIGRTSTAIATASGPRTSPAAPMRRWPLSNGSATTSGACRSG